MFGSFHRILLVFSGLPCSREPGKSQVDEGCWWFLFSIWSNILKNTKHFGKGKERTNEFRFWRDFGWIPHQSESEVPILNSQIWSMETNGKLTFQGSIFDFLYARDPETWHFVEKNFFIVEWQAICIHLSVSTMIDHGFMVMKRRAVECFRLKIIGAPKTNECPPFQNHHFKKEEIIFQPSFFGGQLDAIC